MSRQLRPGDQKKDRSNYIALNSHQEDIDKSKPKRSKLIQTIIVVELVIIALIIVAFGIEEINVKLTYQILRVLFNCFSGTSLVGVIISALVGVLKKYQWERIFNKNNAFIIILSISVWISIVIGNVHAETIEKTGRLANETDEEIIKDQQIDKKITPDNRILYEFDNITEEETYDVLFLKSLDKQSLLEDLEYSLTNIAEHIKYDDDTINANEEYGEMSNAANIYEDTLDLWLKSDCDLVEKGEIIRDLVEAIFNFRREMDLMYQTPSNRRIAANVLQKEYLNGLSVSGYDTCVDCIRWLWGTLYIEIATDQYNPKTVEKLIEIYTQLSAFEKTTRENKDRISDIIDVLDDLKATFEVAPPSPIENTK